MEKILGPKDGVQGRTRNTEVVVPSSAAVIDCVIELKFYSFLKILLAGDFWFPNLDYF